MRTIAYVCVHNAGRSQMAEAFTNYLAEQQGMSVRAFSAGTAAGDRINPAAAEAMAEVGIAMEGMHPKTLTREMADTADIIITMGCGVDAEACPALRYVSEDWGLEDPAGQSIAKVREVRDQICRRVQDLLNRLSSER